MRSTRRSFFPALLLAALVSLTLTSHAPSPVWGFFGHKKINELAIYTLPPEMFGFYKSHMDYLIEHAVDPDKRRYSVKGEAERHYIDLDHYCAPSGPCNPFAQVPRRWTEAVEKFGEDSLRAHGIVPWQVYLMTVQLTEAFRDENVDRILRLSAEMGHYVGDAHVPLHTTSNYNGQKTGQVGIHGFWESRLPELYEANYDFFVGRAAYVDRPLDFIWNRVEESFAAVDSVLHFESQLNTQFPTDRKFSYESRGQTNVRVYSEPYSSEYNLMLDGQVERRMRTAVLSLGSLWYTCWVNAGQPDLDKYVSQNISDREQRELAAEDSLHRDPALKVRDHEN